MLPRLRGSELAEGTNAELFKPIHDVKNTLAFEYRFLVFQLLLQYRR